MSEPGKKEVTLYLSRCVVEKLDELVEVNKVRHRWTRSWLVDNMLGDRLNLWPWKDDNTESDEE